EPLTRCYLAGGMLDGLRFASGSVAGPDAAAGVWEVDAREGTRPSMVRNRRLTARLFRWSRLMLPSRTVRSRVTLVYGGMFIVSGAALLAITYILVLYFTANIK